MDLSRAEYPAIVGSIQPSPAVKVLRDRLHNVQALNTEIADWLQERRRIEEAYVLGLNKLVKRPLPGEASDLGVFQGPWARIVNSTAAIAASHNEFREKIDFEVERPLREFTSRNQEWVGMKHMETTLATAAKAIDSAEDRSEKLKRKGGKAKAQQLSDAATAISNALAEWDSQAPFIFEKLQAADESRCNQLRDALTRFQTLEVDQAQRNMQTAEESLNVILDISTDEEIKGFANRVTAGKLKIERQTSRTASTTPGLPSSSTPSIVTDDSVSLQSSGSGGGASGGASGSGHSLGLKRLGTVFRPRNRNSSIPNFKASFGRRSSEAIGPSRAQPPPLPGSANGSTGNLPSTSKSEGNGLAVPSPPRPSTAGYGSSPTPTPKQNGDSNGDLSSSILDAPQPPITTPSVTITPEELPTDSEGYSIPPPIHDLGGNPMSDENLEEQGQPQFKLDIKSHVIEEAKEEADAALSKVASTLRAQNTVTRKTRGRRDARDVRNTMFIPNAQPDIPEDYPSSPPLTPLKYTTRPSTVASEAGSDTQSIRSARSVTSLAGTAIKHPDLTEPGLSASLVEAISVSFEQGQATKAMIIGEIALAYNPKELATEPVTETIRMDNFAVLEKVAPNPAFISPALDKAGEYSVVLTNIHKTSVAFKYQVHVEDAAYSAFVPIIITPVWKIEPHQSSIILHWKPNPEFRRLNGTNGPFVMRNVMFVTGIEGATTTTCQSKPMGIFSREKGRLAWKLGDVTIGLHAEDEGAQRLLARFATDGTARSTPVEVRWEITGEDANIMGSGLSLSSPVEPAIVEEDDPFADVDAEATSPSSSEFSGTWKNVCTVKKVMSGKYIAV
ncbi:Suppressor of Profilin deletion [Rhizina undulata]